MAETPEDQRPTIFCAWCRRVIEWGERGISHGLCVTCVPIVLDEIHARLAEPASPASPAAPPVPGAQCPVPPAL